MSTFDPDKVKRLLHEDCGFDFYVREEDYDNLLKMFHDLQAKNTNQDAYITVLERGLKTAKGML